MAGIPAEEMSIPVDSSFTDTPVLSAAVEGAVDISSIPECGHGNDKTVRTLFIAPGSSESDQPLLPNILQIHLHLHLHLHLRLPFPPPALDWTPLSTTSRSRWLTRIHSFHLLPVIQDNLAALDARTRLLGCLMDVAESASLVGVALALVRAGRMVCVAPAAGSERAGHVGCLEDDEWRDAGKKSRGESKEEGIDEEGGRQRDLC